MFGKWYICLHIDLKSGISAHIDIPTLADLLLVQNRIKRYICAHIDFKNGISAHIPTFVIFFIDKRGISAHIPIF